MADLDASIVFAASETENAMPTYKGKCGIGFSPKALLTFLWVAFHDRPGSGGQRPPRAPLQIGSKLGP